MQGGNQPQSTCRKIGCGDQPGGLLIPDAQAHKCGVGPALGPGVLLLLCLLGSRYIAISSPGGVSPSMGFLDLPAGGLQTGVVETSVSSQGSL